MSHDPCRERPEAPRSGHEVGIGELGPDHAVGIRSLLGHADGPEHRAVDDEDDGVDPVVHRGGDLPPGHQRTAVAAERDHRTVRLADEHHHRRRVLRGVVEADGRVAGARPACDHDDSRPSGELAVGFRHVRGAALVPAGDRRDRAARVAEGIEGCEIALTRHAEDGVDAVDRERVDRHPAAGAPKAVRHVRQSGVRESKGREFSHRGAR